MLAAAAEDQAHGAGLFRRLRIARNHPAGGIRHGRAGVIGEVAMASVDMASSSLARDLPIKDLPTKDLAILAELERKVLWLATWTIHHANHVRENGDGLKVGGHQASCASAATVLTALYFHA